MQTIKCPYDWFCGEEFGLEKLSKKEFVLLENAIQKNMKFVFITCPKCNSSFELNPQSFTSKPTLKNPNEIQPKNEKNKNDLIKILKSEGVFLPKEYLEFISKDKKLEVKVEKQRAKFKLFSLNKLCENININDKKYLHVKALKGFLDTLPKEMIAFLDETIAYDVLKNCPTIASENTTYLFLDIRDNKTLFIFESSDFYIKKVDITLEKLYM
ncbi:MAG: hypothetical protein ACK5LP_08435 [Campylobacteraceae bacterium]